MGAAPDEVAVLEDEDLVGGGDRRHALGDDDDGGVGRVRLQGQPQAGVGGQVERRERVVEEVDLGLADQRPGDRQPLALTAGHVRAALLDAGLEAARHRPHEVVGLGDAQRLPHLVLGGVGLAEPQVARRRCRRTGTAAAGTRPMRSHSTSGARSRTSTPSTSTLPLVASNSRGTRLTSVVLPAPVLPTIAVVRPARRRERDVAEHGLLGAGVVEADAAQLEPAARRRRRGPGRRRHDRRSRCRAPPGCGRRPRRRGAPSTA